MLTATDKKRMPPKESGDPLPQRKIELIERWIKEGAKLDAGLKPKSDLLRELRCAGRRPQPPAVYPYPRHGHRRRLHAGQQESRCQRSS